jgi:hypothetical protein
MQYKKDLRRTVKRKCQFDKTINEMITETGKKDFRINVFFVILDKLYSELVRRSSLYKDLCVKFDFLTNICSFDEEIISEKTRALIEQYPNDIEKSFTN